MTYRKHRFEWQQHESARVAKNGNRSFNLIQTDRMGKKSVISCYGVPDKVIEQERLILHSRLLRERARYQKHPVATWIEAVSLKQTKLGYSDWTESQCSYDDIEAILDSLQL